MNKKIYKVYIETVSSYCILIESDSEQNAIKKAEKSLFDATPYEFRSIKSFAHVENKNDK